MESICRYLKRIGYYKSGHVLQEYDGGIFISREKVKWIKRKYETLIDSRGNSHEVQVEHKRMSKWFKDEDFCIKEGSLFPVEHKHLDTNHIKFQFNLKKYIVIPNRPVFSNYRSCNELIGHFANDKYNNGFVEKSRYEPIREIICQGAGPWRITNYVSDSIFFKHKNRELALQRIPKWHAKIFRDDGYLKMSKT